MITPRTRKEFESHINLLIDDSDRIIETTYFIRMVNSLKGAKFLPNNRTNFLTIDEQLRLLANMQAQFRRMGESAFKVPRENND